MMSLIIIFMLAAVSYGGFDVPYDASNISGSISVCGGISVSHSLLASAPAGAHENNSKGSGHEQDIEKASVVFDIFGKLIRKLLQLFTGSNLIPAAAHIRYYFLSLCISGCTCLYFLSLIRFIHLTDGSK